MTRGVINSMLRKKIWQIEPNFHCAIVGTCLSRADLRKIKRRKAFSLPATTTDYEMHNVLAGTSANKTAQTRIVQKVLDEKYAAIIKKYSKLHSEEEIWDEWQKDVKKGDASGAFWAIMSHGDASLELRSKVYGECHMISFDMFSVQRSSSSQLKRLENSVQRESIKAKELRTKLDRQQEQSKDLRAKLKESNNKNKQLSAENTSLKKELENLQKKLTGKAQAKEIENLQKGLAEAQAALSRAEQEVKQQTEKQQALTKQVQQLQLQMLPENSSAYTECKEYVAPSCPLECDSCEDFGTDACTGPDLCGKTILYVGGRSNMISRYRTMIEERGGRFSHHDGGREDSRQLLPRLLSGADLVLCPVDCVSHDACKQVKRICKRCSKPFVMMRSSGISALEKELEAVA